MPYPPYSPPPYPGGPYPPDPPAPYPPEKAEEKAARKALRRSANLVSTALLGILPAAAALGLALSGLLLAMGYSLRGAAEYSFLSPELYYLYQAVVYACSLLLPACIVIAAARLKWGEMLVFQACGPLEFFGSVFLGVAVCLLSNIPANLISALLQGMGFSGEAPSTPLPDSVLGQALYFVNLAVIPPLFEEFLFRGLALGALRRFGDGFAVLASSFLFAMLHGNFIQIPFAFLAGLVMGFVMIRTNCLWVPILIHFCNNAFSVFTQILARSSEDLAAGASLLYFLAMLLLAIVFSVLLLRLRPHYFYGDGKKGANGCALRARSKAFAFFTSPVTLVFLAYCLLTAVLYL